MPDSVDLCRKCILKLTPYVPGKPIEEVKRELGIDDIVKLASNENPLGPSRKAVEAMRAALENVALYPEGSCFELRQVVAKSLGVSPDMLIFGAGAVEAHIAGLGAGGHLSLLAAMLALAVFFAPWATTAALRIALE